MTTKVQIYFHFLSQLNSRKTSIFFLGAVSPSFTHSSEHPFSPSLSPSLPACSPSLYPVFQSPSRLLLLHRGERSPVQGVMLVAQLRAVLTVELTEPAPVSLDGRVLLHQHGPGDVRLIVPNHHIPLKLSGGRGESKETQTLTSD